MNEFYDNDHLLFIIYKRFEDTLIDYEKDCTIIESAQAKASGPVHIPLPPGI